MNGYFSIMGGLGWCSTTIMQNIPPHMDRVELTCGRGELVWMLRPSDGLELLNDKDHLLIKMHEIVRDRMEDILPELLKKQWVISRELFNSFRADPMMMDDAEFLYRMLFLFAGGKRGDEIFKDVFWDDREGRDLSPVIDRLKLASHRLKGVTLSNKDALDCLKWCDQSPDAFVFVDPPYPSRERYYRIHDFPWPAICHRLSNARCKWMLVSDVNLSSRVGEGKRLGTPSVLKFIRDAHAALLKLEQDHYSIRLKEPFRMSQQFKNRLQFNGKTKEYAIVANYELKPMPVQAMLFDSVPVG